MRKAQQEGRTSGNGPTRAQRKPPTMAPEEGPKTTQGKGRPQGKAQQGPTGRARLICLILLSTVTLLAIVGMMLWETFKVESAMNTRIYIYNTSNYISTQAYLGLSLNPVQVNPGTRHFVFVSVACKHDEEAPGPWEAQRGPGPQASKGPQGPGP